MTWCFGHRPKHRFLGAPPSLLPVAPLVVGLLGSPGPLRAQSPRVEVDMSAMRIEYDSLAPLDAPSLSALSEWLRPSLFARVAASVTAFRGAGWSVQGRGDTARWLSPFGVLSPLRVELAGTAGASHHSAGFDSFVVDGAARLHLRSASLGAWAGASFASARNSYDTAAVYAVAPGVGGWVQTGGLRATASLLYTSVSGNGYPEANLSLTYTRGPADLTVWAGSRRSPFEGAGLDERWLGASAAYWVTDHVAFVLTGGRYGSDVLQGLPGGEFISLGLRLSPRRVRPIPVSARAPIVYTPESTRTGGIGFVVEGAERVEVAGDWNGWVVEPLARDGSGRWVVPASLEPGIYRFNLRVDGERWVVPDEVPSVDDGYGGRVGLLIVSEPE